MLFHVSFKPHREGAPPGAGLLRARSRREAEIAIPGAILTLLEVSTAPPPPANLPRWLQ